ncbi:uncharacterized protein SEPMUDRAFT_146674 [Sphaerulina musiva SO2202]|uniref:Uncharacterized protein n=1 Tax=Sphaerulina musiva (strain SO2202) TaxID=692275 RepID=N1QKD9_SPHMS|nr:uncharacterized protein SEPMUDRAFT_146674 [Sphaerulina musiva SO2202]EMF17701.1 hypothetical protein SEPMUDRAFT_146674 [Sphaerulina musiva SO2202]
MTLYFHISIFRHNFSSCPVRLALSYCIQTSFKTHIIPHHTSSQHPSSSTSSTHNPKLNAATTPTMSSRLSKNALQTTNPKVRYMYFCTFSSSSSFLSACPHVPTHLPLLHQTQHSQHQLRA